MPGRRVHRHVALTMATPTQRTRRPRVSVNRTAMQFIFDEIGRNNKNVSNIKTKLTALGFSAGATSSPFSVMTGSGWFQIVNGEVDYVMPNEGRAGYGFYQRKLISELRG